MRRSFLAAAAATAVLSTALLAPAAQAANFSDVLDSPSYWLQGDSANIYQWVNTSYSSTHPLYSIHRLDVLLDDGRKPVDGITYLKLNTSFSVPSGSVNQDEFVSAVRLPRGVRVVDTPQTPIFCHLSPSGLLSDTPVPFTPVTDGTCRQGVKDLGQNTFAVNDTVLNRGDIWEVYVPVASDRALGAADGAQVSFFSSHSNKDATMPDLAEATKVLVIGAPGTSPAKATAKAGAKCAKAGVRAGSLKCVKTGGKLVWKRA